MASQTNPQPGAGSAPATGGRVQFTRDVTAGWPAEAFGMRRLLQVMIAVELAYAAFLLTTWFQTGDLAAGGAALLDALAAAVCGAVWVLARRGRVVAAASTLALGVFGFAIPLAAVPPAIPALVLLPLFGTAIALQYVGGRVLHRLMILGWITSVVIAVIVELVPAGGPQPAWYYPLMRISSFCAVIGITLVLLAQFGSRLRHGLAAAEAAAEALRWSEAHYRTLVAQAPLAIVVVDQEWRVVEANPTAERLMGRPAADFLGRGVPEFIEPGHLAAHPVRLAQLALGETLRSEQVLVDGEGTTFSVEVHASLLDDGRFQLIIADISERKRAEADHARLVQAVEQSADSILITDPSATIVYVNPAFERASGYSRAEALGANPSILKSGAQDPELYRAMWAELAAGRPWSGELVNRHKDGTFYREQATISPVRDAQGALVSYVALQRDVTHERALEARDVRRARERALIADALGALRPLDTAEQTAGAICTHVVELPEIAMASLLLLDPDGSALPLAMTVDDGRVLERRSLGSKRSAQLRTRAAQGPWVEEWRPRPGHPYLADHLAIGLRGQAYAPVRSGTTLIGLLTVGSRDPDAVALLTERLPAILEFAALAGALLAPSVALTGATAAARGSYQAILDDRAFHPVFQPIVDLASGAVVGYEALTRFADGTAPDLIFAGARRCGLEPELESATLRAAIAASEVLPGGCFLSLNVSPALILAGDELRAILATRTRPIVLEVTEHDTIDDYGALRSAFVALGSGLRLAVDDAGAGVANFNHLVELRPQLVKVDIGLVRGVNADLTRQALIVALLHFARSTDCRLVAEGIETEAERAALEKLEVEFGQGYLFGRPAEASIWAAPAAAPSTPRRTPLRAIAGGRQPRA
jgi:PAS domain S-box-containing protein